jgi:hypothetical protein
VSEVRFHRAAAQEAEAAVRWYNEHDVGRLRRRELFEAYE